MATLKEIAAETGLSVSVVSRALNPVPDRNARVSEATRALVADAAARLGFRPNRAAQGLKKGQAPSLGVFLPEYANRLIADLVMGMSEEANLAGFPLSFHFGLTQEHYDHFFRQLADEPQSGLITYPHALAHDDLLARKIQNYHKRGGSVVVLNTEQRFPGIPVVEIDDREGGAQAARHLLARGCGSFLVFPRFRLHRRGDGFRSEIEAAGHACRIEDDIGVVLGALKTYVSTRHGTAPAGVFAVSDRHALALITQLKMAGFAVGEDVLVIGYDDLDLTDLAEPPLTTIHQPFREEGRIAVRKLLGIISGSAEDSVSIPPALIVRRSA